VAALPRSGVREGVLEQLYALGSRAGAEAAWEEEKEKQRRRAGETRAATERQGFEPWDQVITQSTA
jgi:hypothetical protein